MQLYFNFKMQVPELKYATLYMSKNLILTCFFLKLLEHSKIKVTCKLPSLLRAEGKVSCKSNLFFLFI